MFLKKPTRNPQEIDLKISSLEWKAGSVRVLIGPRFAQWVYNGWNFPESTSAAGSFSVLNLFNFYTHGSSSSAQSLFDFLKSKQTPSEISRYFPLSQFNGKLSYAAQGGSFEVPIGQKTIFWMKIPSRPDQGTDFTRLKTHWCRIEYGTILPSFPNPRYSGNNVSYDTILPFLSVTPSNGNLNVDRYEIGEIKHFNPDYYSIQNGVRRDLVFPFSKLSSYF
jgi:hypothetical protein